MKYAGGTQGSSSSQAPSAQQGSGATQTCHWLSGACLWVVATSLVMAHLSIVCHSTASVALARLVSELLPNIVHTAR